MAARSPGKIIPTGQYLGWLEAREVVKDKGGLPSNVLHDEYLVYKDEGEPFWGEKLRYKNIEDYYPAWAREILVYPAKGDMFKKGEDVIDAELDEKGRKWVFPASFISKNAIGKEKVGLFVDPEDVKVETYKGEPAVIIYPKSIIVLHGFIQVSGQRGKADKKTKVPLEIATKVAEKLSLLQMRYLYRLDGAGVRPLVRMVTDYLDDIYLDDVFANQKSSGRCGVGYVVTSNRPPTKIIKKG